MVRRSSLTREEEGIEEHRCGIRPTFYGDLFMRNIKRVARTLSFLFERLALLSKDREGSEIGDFLPSRPSFLVREPFYSLAMRYTTIGRGGEMVPSRNACFLPPFPPACLPESLAPLFIQVFFVGNVSPDRPLSVVWTGERERGISVHIPT